jgi:uncharacterized protein (TIGR03435 family)
MVGPAELEYRCWSTVPRLLSAALDLPPYTASNERSPMYFIDAIMKRPSTQEELNQMLLSLLLDRFELSYHIEQREVDGYFLTIDPKRARPSLATDLPGVVRPMIFAVGHSDSDRPPIRPGTFDLDRTRSGDEAYLTGRAVTVRMLATYLSTCYKLVVVDESGLTSRYDFRVTYKNPLVPDKQFKSAAPDIWTAVANELGLKVTHRRGKIDVLVIDRSRKVPR